jgi:DNA repair protein RecO
LATGKNLDILSSGDFIRAYIGSDSSLIEIKTATFFVEVIDRLIPEKEPLPDLYKLLVVSLAEINRNPRLAKLYFESHFYRLSGVFPDTTNCVVCGNREDEPINFSPRLNGVVCSLCSHKTSGIVTLQQGVIPYWEKLAKSELPLPHYNDSQLNEALKLSDSYMRNLNTKEFKSDKI